MKRIIFNICMIILAFCVQNCIFPQLPFLAAAPNLLLIITFSMGFIHGSNAGMLYGLLCGILLDLFYTGPLGFYTLIFVFLGYVNGICTRYYYEDYIVLPLILSVANDLVYNVYIYIFRFLVRNRLDFLFYFRKILIPEMIFTIVVTLLVYRCFLFLTRKLENMEKGRDTKIV